MLVYNLKMGVEVMFKKLNFLCIFLGIIEFVCFQNWTVCLIV